MRALLLLTLPVLLSLGSATSAQEYPLILMETSKGNITFELWPDKAPVSVENFLRYTDKGLYDGLIFHRVIPGFMIQGGGFTVEMMQVQTLDPISNEASADTPNNRGTLAMARTSEINSATSQFFVNLIDNDFLNHQNETPAGFGYAVFGEVVEGMEVVDDIAMVPTGRSGAFSDVPTEPVIIRSVRRAEAD